MKSTIISTTIALVLVVTQVIAADTCSATVVATPRSGNSASWTENGELHTIYDIKVKNTGSCDIVSLASYYYSDGYVINPSWNYNNATGKIDFGSSSLVSGAEFNGAGFVVSGPKAPSQLYIRGDCGSRACGSFYYQQPGSVSSSSPSSSSSSSSSSSPSSAPTETPTEAPVDQCGGCQENQVCINTQTGYTCQYRSCSDTVCPSNVHSVCINDGGEARCISTQQNSCLASAVVKARSGGAFLDNGLPSQIYDVTIVGYSASDVTVEIDPFPFSTVSQTWNLNLQSGSSNQYTLAAHGALSASTTSAYYGSGFVLKNVTSNDAPKVGVSSVTCISS